MKINFQVIVFFLLVSFTYTTQGQIINYDPGNGINISALSNKWDFFFSGYVNSMFTFQNIKGSNIVQNSFSVHRARLDLGFDYNRKYKAFFEFEAAGQRTAMVLAQVQVTLFKKNYLMAGKFLDPFSPENNRSTSRLTTIERYSGLNSIFLLPGLDTQFGLMFFGSAGKLNYFLSAMNGNGEAGQNISENNNSKEVTARLELKATDNFNFGASFSAAKEQPQHLELVDHIFDAFNYASINGERFGYLGYFEYKSNPLLFRGEAFQYSFSNNLSLSNQIKGFIGGYFELGSFIYGNSENGFQLIGRFETARYEKTISNFKGPTILNSYLFGTNLFLDNILSFQVNLIYEKANRTSIDQKSRFYKLDNELLLLSTLQLRF